MNAALNLFGFKSDGDSEKLHCYFQEILKLLQFNVTRVLVTVFITK